MRVTILVATYRFSSLHIYLSQPFHRSKISDRHFRCTLPASNNQGVEVQPMEATKSTSTNDQLLHTVTLHSMLQANLKQLLGIPAIKSITKTRSLKQSRNYNKHRLGICCNVSDVMTLLHACNHRPLLRGDQYG